MRGAKRRANGVASGGVERWAFSGENAFVRCRTWLVQGVVAAHWQEGGKEGGKRSEVQWRFFGGRNGRPGQCKPGCLPDDTVALLGCRVICLFFFLYTQAELDSACSGRRFPLFLLFFSRASGVHVYRIVSYRGGRGKKWARYLCQDNTGEHVHPCERDPKSALEGSYTHSYSPLGSSCCRQVTGWCRSNIFGNERSWSICVEMRSISALCIRKRALTIVTWLSTVDLRI